MIIEEEEGRKMKKSSSKSDNYECCMCGDLGLSHHLFRCSLCHFRSQHRYCSNLYPRAETYRVCNWCLSHTQTDDATNDQQVEMQVELGQGQGQGATTPTTKSNDNSNSPEAEEGHPDHHHIIIINKTTTKTTTTTMAANNDKINSKHQHPKPKVISIGGAAKSHSPNSLQPSPIIKKARSPPESRSPSGRKRNTDSNRNRPQALNKDHDQRPSKSKLMMRRHYAKSSDEEMLMLMLIPSSSSSSSSSSSITNKNNSTSCSGSPASNSGSGGAVMKPVVRNKYKVRRYKLLDEVSY